MDKITYASLSSLGDDFHAQLDSALEKLRGNLGETHPLIIGGQQRKSKIGVFQDISPANSRIILAKFQNAEPGDVSKAVAAAKTAFGEWSKTSWEQRASILRTAAKLIDDRQFELAALLILENGKNRFEAIAEISETSALILYYCQEMERNAGFMTEMGSDTERVRSMLKPYGAWGVVSPFNFPMALPAGMIAAALLAGNTVVFKPGSDTPWTGLTLFNILHEAGVPDGVVNYITGPGNTVGEALLGEPDLDGIAFTGSRNVGMQVAARFGRLIPKPCVVEMGGKNPALIMQSADIDLAAEGVVRSAFGMSGQKCSACSRVLIHKSIYKEFMDALLEKTEALTIGDPVEKDTFMGPLINQTAAKRFERSIRQILFEGRIVRGGRRIRRIPYTHGFYAEPTIVDRLAKESSIVREELFVPILVVNRIGSMQEAIFQANETPFGLTAGIYTRDDEEKQAFLDSVQAGVLYCNRRGGATSGAWPGVQSFGGWKSSGTTGKNALGPHYLPEFMREQSQTEPK